MNQQQLIHKATHGVTEDERRAAKRAKRTEPTTREVVDTMRELVEGKPRVQPAILTDILHKMLEFAAERAYSEHHLKYVHTEDDGSFTFVCICGAGYSERENWNLHIKESFYA